MNIKTALKVCKYARIVNTTSNGSRQIEIRTPADHKDPNYTETLKKVDVYIGEEETKDINEAKVVDVEPMSEHGFVVVRFTHAEEKYSMAACLEADIEALTVKKSDSGMTWGNCGDSNSEAFEVFGQETAIEWFFKQIEGHVAII